MELLERLEISVLNLSEVNKFNDRFRFDPEFFKKEYIDFEKLLKSKKFKSLSNIKFKIIHPSEIKRIYVESDGVWFFRTQNIRPLKIEQSNDVFISDDDAKKLKNNLIKKNDVVITRTGANFGQTAIYNIDKIAIGSSHTFLLRNEYFNQSYLAVFFNTKYGRKLIDKGMYGGAQPEIAPYYLSNIPIPDFDFNFQIQIEKLINFSQEKINVSKSTYTQAETILLQEIGLDERVTSSNPVAVTKQAVEGSNPSAITNNNTEKEGFSTPSINVKSFKDSFGVTGRLDAEYYQKKYEVVIDKIKSQNYDVLQNITSISKSLEPGSHYYSDDETGLPFMRVADYNKFGLSEPNKKLTFDFIKDNQDKIDDLKPKKGSILFSKDGSVGTAYHLREDFEGITSSAILNLKVRNEKEVIPEYLTLALNSKLVQMQAERDAGGSIILHWRIGEIQNVVVPIIDYKKQQEIAKLIEESFSLKKQSEHLLEVAKRAVEIAIEESEEIAIKYIDDNSIF